MSIKEDCIVNISAEEIREAVKIYMIQKGYDVIDIEFLSSYSYVDKILDGARINVKNKIQKNI